MVPVGIVDRLLVALPVAPGEQQGQGDHRHDDEQHQAGGGEDQVALLHGHVARRLHDDEVAAGEHRRERKRARGPARGGPRCCAGGSGRGGSGPRELTCQRCRRVRCDREVCGRPAGRAAGRSGRAGLRHPAGGASRPLTSAASPTGRRGAPRWCRPRRQKVEADAGEPVLRRQAERDERREAGAEQPGEVGGERRAGVAVARAEPRGHRAGGLAIGQASRAKPVVTYIVWPIALSPKISGASVLARGEQPDQAGADEQRLAAADLVGDQARGRDGAGAHDRAGGTAPS